MQGEIRGGHTKEVDEEARNVTELPTVPCAVSRKPQSTIVNVPAKYKNASKQNTLKKTDNKCSYRLP